jgi:hypothetical protein
LASIVVVRGEVKRRAGSLSFEGKEERNYNIL